jgi:threonine dehydrogenase-like Zn-dependent dehydrogenase
MSAEQTPFALDFRSDFEKWLDERRRDHANLAKATGIEAARTGDPDGHELAVRTIRRLVAEHGTVTADDVQAATPIRSNAIGSAFAHLARAGEITVVGYTKATRPQAHGRLVRVWGLP